MGLYQKQLFGTDGFVILTEGKGPGHLTRLDDKGAFPREYAALFVNAPDLLAACQSLADLFARDGENSVERFERLAEMFRKDTGYLAPGKDAPAAGSMQPDRDELNRIYDDWYASKIVKARAAISRALPGGEGK